MATVAVINLKTKARRVIVGISERPSQADERLRAKARQDGLPVELVVASVLGRCVMEPDDPGSSSVYGGLAALLCECLGSERVVVSVESAEGASPTVRYSAGPTDPLITLDKACDELMRRDRA